MTDADPGFVHRWVPGSGADAPTLLVLHGTGGNEDDLLQLAATLAPGAAMLSPRGKILEHGMPRFFRRLAEGVFDLEDLQFRTHELADFVDRAADAYGFDQQHVVAVGYSNGANIAAALLLLRPETLSGGALFHAMVPLEPAHLPDLSNAHVFLGAGRRDPIVLPENTERLEELLLEAGADVSMHWEMGGHELNRGEIRAAQGWFVEYYLGHEKTIEGSS